MSAPFLVVPISAMPRSFRPVGWTDRKPITTKRYRYVAHARVRSFNPTGLEVVQADPEAPTCSLDVQAVRLRVGKASFGGYYFIPFFFSAAEAATSMNGPYYLIGREE